MTIKVGDAITVDSERAGSPARQGTVLEVLEADFGTRYRVRWADGRETTIYPIAGTIHVSRDPFEVLAEVWR